MTDEVKKVVEVFEQWCSNAVDEKGIYPLPMVALAKDGAMEVSALAVSGEEAMQQFLRQIVKRQVLAIMLGLDRTTKPGQGTEFADVLTCALWVAEKDDWEPDEWRKWFRVGVINYQVEPRIVRPIDWENKFWDGKVREELDNMRIKRRSTGEEL